MHVCRQPSSAVCVAAGTGATLIHMGQLADISKICAEGRYAAMHVRTQATATKPISVHTPGAPTSDLLPQMN